MSRLSELEDKAKRAGLHVYIANGAVTGATGWAP